MKIFFIILFSFAARNFSLGQISKPTFFDIEKEIKDEYTAMNKAIDEKVGPLSDPTDTIKEKIYSEEWMKQFDAFNIKKNKILEKLNGISYPDFYFEDFNGKAHSLSDYKNQKVVLNFNYEFCTSCISQIDSIIKMAGKKAKIIVLLYDSRGNARHIYEKHGDNILLGFISSQHSNFYGLNCGSFCTFLMDENRSINYFSGSTWRKKTYDELYKNLKDF